MSRKVDITLTVNGKLYVRAADTRATFVDFLRDELKLKGTHIGCEHGVCGACTVLVDGEAVRSCLMLAPQADGASVVTIEGLCEPDGELCILQKAFRKHHALQCGFCTPGILTTAHALLTQEPDADEDRIRHVLSGNLCRCTGYITIVKAILDARDGYRERSRSTSMP
jgi:carbon-monoxide dehydrogenase small subunit